MWEVQFEEEHGYFANTKKGFGIIRQLLQFQSPQVPFDARVLLGWQESGPKATHTEQPALDSEAKKALKKRYDELQEWIGNAEVSGDADALERYRAEVEQLALEVSRAMGAHGRDRLLGSKAPTDKARISVRQALNRVYIELTGASPPLPKLVDHLKSSIQTAGECYAYRPSVRYSWEFD